VRFVEQPEAALRKALEVSGVRGRIRTAIENAAASQSLHPAILQGRAAWAVSEARAARAAEAGSEPSPGDRAWDGRTMHTELPELLVDVEEVVAQVFAKIDSADDHMPGNADSTADSPSLPAQAEREVDPAPVRGSTTEEAADTSNAAGADATEAETEQDAADTAAMLDEEVSDTARSDVEEFWAAVPVDDVKAQPDEPVLDEDAALDSAVDTEKQPPRKEKPRTSQAAYPEAAAQFFGESFAHRLRWSHAVNSKRKLRVALISTAQFVEADVSFGSLVCRDANNGRSRYEATEPKTTVYTDAGDHGSLPN